MSLDRIVRFILVSCIFFASPAPASAAITVTNLADSGAGSLRAAIASAVDGDTIDFAVTGTITLTSGELLVNKSITIAGAGARDLTISGNDASRVFHVPAGEVVSITDLTLSDGLSPVGGAILNGGDLTLVRMTIRDSGNSGIHNESGGALSVADSTVVGNFATNDGAGGIANFGGTIEIINSTITANTSSSGYGGGGVLNLSFPGVATATIVSSTIADNTNTAFGGRGNAIADAFSPAGSVTLKSTILDSTAPGITCYPAGFVVTSLGNNIARDASCALSGTGDLSSTDPLLETLADNGGDTDTHALSVDPPSPALDHVPTADCTDASAVPIVADQRGEPRPGDGDGDDDPRCDAGAYELASLPANCPYVPSQSCATAAGGSFAIKINADPTKSTLAWKWSKGALAASQSDFGDPVGGTARARLCVYDGRAGSLTFVTAATVDPGGTCDGKPCWRAVSDKGWSYSNKSGNADAITKARFKGGDPTKPQAQLKGRGASLPLPVPFGPSEMFDQDPEVTVQLHTGGPIGCVTTEFSPASSSKNDEAQFKAKLP